MRNIETNLIGQEFSFAELDDVLHELGFTRGSMWDYDYADYDYPLQLTKLGENVFLRICTHATSGKIEGRGCVVMINQIGLIGGKYQQGVQAQFKADRRQLDRSRELLEQMAARYQFPVEISFETLEKTTAKQYAADMLPTA